MANKKVVTKQTEHSYTTSLPLSTPSLLHIPARVDKHPKYQLILRHYDHIYLFIPKDLASFHQYILRSKRYPIAHTTKPSLPLQLRVMRQPNQNKRTSIRPFALSEPSSAFRISTRNKDIDSCHKDIDHSSPGTRLLPDEESLTFLPNHRPQVPPWRTASLARTRHSEIRGGHAKAYYSVRVLAWSLSISTSSRGHLNCILAEIKRFCNVDNIEMTTTKHGERTYHQPALDCLNS